ncbi:isochorismatase family protein [Ancylobacter terrae]|uniref:isochorismatase family protein n=1 Tax=Ancylobacter sp. sgz301288 TaxID=3342077 RepID=UPI00385A58C7
MMEHSLENKELIRYYEDRGWCGRVGFGERPAIVVVDLAKCWMKGSKIGSDLSAVVEATISLLKRGRAAGIPIFFSTMAFEPDLSDAGGVIEKKLRHFDDMIKGSPEIELLPELDRQPGEVFFVKQRPSCFYGTNLLSQLIGHSVDTIIVTGCSTSGCIRATCESGIDNNFRVIVPKEAVGDRCKSAHEANLFDINARYADVLPIGEVADYLDGLAARRRGAAA